jgi:replicative DNA helicase
MVYSYQKAWWIMVQKPDKEVVLARDEATITPPFDLEAEQSLLGTWLKEGRTHQRYLEFPVHADSFYFEEHQDIAKVINDYVLQGKGTDPVLVSAELNKRKQLEVVGGAAYLRKLCELVPSMENCSYYAAMVKELATKRNILCIARDTYEHAFSPAITADELQRSLAKALDAIDQPQDVTLGAVVENAISEQKDEEKSSDHWPKCGIGDLDNNMGGFKPGACTIVAGFPGTGKSSLAGYITYMAAKRGHAVGYLSLEMSQSELVNRCMAIEGVAPNRVMNQRKLTKLQLFEYEKVGRDIIAPLKMWLLDKVGNNPNAILTEIRRQRVVHGVALFVVDYLQLVQPDSGTQTNFNQFLSSFTAQLKNTARMLDCHIIEVSQVSRDAFKDNRDLTMHDLRDSGSLEANADNVILLNAIESSVGTDEDPTAIIGVNIAKQRSGSNMTRFALSFQKDMQAWSSPKGDVDLPEPRTKRMRKKPYGDDADIVFN